MTNLNYKTLKLHLESQHALVLILIKWQNFKSFRLSMMRSLKPTIMENQSTLAKHLLKSLFAKRPKTKHRSMSLKIHLIMGFK